jgi:hypothetical protein
MHHLDTITSMLTCSSVYVNIGEGTNGSIQPKGPPKVSGAWLSSILGCQASSGHGATRILGLY